MLQVGSRIGSYEIVAALGSGGMAHLYLGRRKGPGGFERAVAIKVIKRAFASRQDFVKMFLDEARIASRIQHPNVVHIQELGEENGNYFLVMEYVAGVSLAELLTKLVEIRRRLTPAAAVALATQALAGLHAAHETRDDEGKLLNVVHRDVSPQNVLLGTTGEVKLIDFGVAKARGRLHVTSAGAGRKGKLRYMAPEQINGQEVDRRTDVYSLGVMLWEMLTMRRLFDDASDVEVIQRIREGDAFPPPGTFASDVPFELDSLLLSALSKDGAKRPESARAFRMQLREAVPEAKDVDDLDLSALLWALMGDKLSERTSQPSIPLNTVELDTLPAKALQRLTAPVENDGFLDAETLPSSALSPEQFAAMTGTDVTSGAFSGPRATAPAPAPPSVASEEVPARSVPPSAGRTSRWVLVVAAIAGILAGAGGVYLALRGAQETATESPAPSSSDAGATPSP